MSDIEYMTWKHSNDCKAARFHAWNERRKNHLCNMLLAFSIAFFAVACVLTLAVRV